MPEGRWITEREVLELITLEDAIDVLADSYALQARGEATSMRRAHAREGDAILHAVGGIVSGRGVTGTKTWTYTPGGAAPLLIIFNLEDGSVRAVIEAFALGKMRTAATTGLGTRILARPDAKVLALLGTGKQALEQARAIAAVRPIERVRIYGRDPGRRADFAARLAEEIAVETSEHGDPGDAARGADIVTAITRSADPFLTGEMLSPGTHVNAVGAIVPSRRELDESAVGACSVIVADSVAQARDDSGELRAAAEAGLLDWSTVRGLDEVVEEAPGALATAAGISLFKALGIGLSDVALGAELAARAEAADVGTPLPTPVLHS
jgi:ornithine cyclodeaminase